MTFLSKGTNQLEFLMGDTSFYTDTNGKKWTFKYITENLVEFPLKRMQEGQIVLMTLTPVITDKEHLEAKSVILDFLDEMVYFRDVSGQIMIAPVILHNQGVMFSIRWDSEESDILDEEGENDKGRMWMKWCDVTECDNPVKYAQGMTAMRNIHRLI